MFDQVTCVNATAAGCEATHVSLEAGEQESCGHFPVRVDVYGEASLATTLYYRQVRAVLALVLFKGTGMRVVVLLLLLVLLVLLRWGGAGVLRGVAAFALGRCVIKLTTTG